MLRQTCTYKSDIKTCKKPKSLQSEKNKKLPVENTDIWLLQ